MHAQTRDSAFFCKEEDEVRAITYTTATVSIGKIALMTSDLCSLMYRRPLRRSMLVLVAEKK